jgi:hypothetical protein
MSFAYVDFSWSQYSIAVLAERMQYRRLRATGYDFDRCDLASIEPAIREPIKVRSKIALRFAGA